MGRIKFKKGQQRRFFQKVLENIGCPSLRELRRRGVSVEYSSLKNYYSEALFLPEDVFDELCKLARINKKKLRFEILGDSWGQVIGGKKGKRKRGILKGRRKKERRSAYPKLRNSGAKK